MESKYEYKLRAKPSELRLYSMLYIMRINAWYILTSVTLVINKYIYILMVLFVVVSVCYSKVVMMIRLNLLSEKRCLEGLRNAYEL